MTLGELLADVVRRLEDADIAYMVTGSVASAFHGEPRATRDLDIVIDPGTKTLAALVEGLLVDGFYVDRDAAFIVLRERRTRPRSTSSSGKTAHSPARNSHDGDLRISLAPRRSSPAWRT